MTQIQGDHQGKLTVFADVMHGAAAGDWQLLGVPVQRLIAIAIHCLVAVRRNHCPATFLHHSGLSDSSPNKCAGLAVGLVFDGGDRIWRWMGGNFQLKC